MMHYSLFVIDNSFVLNFSFRKKTLVYCLLGHCTGRVHGPSKRLVNNVICTDPKACIHTSSICGIFSAVVSVEISDSVKCFNH